MEVYDFGELRKEKEELLKELNRLTGEARIKIVESKVAEKTKKMNLLTGINDEIEKIRHRLVLVEGRIKEINTILKMVKLSGLLE